MGDFSLEPSSELFVDVLGLLWSSDLAGSDCPDGLVSDHDLAPVFNVVLDADFKKEREGVVSYLDKLHLVENDFFGLASFSLLKLFSDAWNDVESSGEGFLALFANEFIGFAKNMSSLGVAEDDPVDSQIPENKSNELKSRKRDLLQEISRSLSGKSALGFFVTVLSGDLDAGIGDFRLGISEVDIWSSTND